MAKKKTTPAPAPEPVESPLPPSTPVEEPAAEPTVEEPAVKTPETELPDTNFDLTDVEGIPPLVRKPVPALSEEQIEALARSFATGHLFSSLSIPNADFRLVESIFMPFGLGACDTMDLHDLGMLCEFYEKAGPRTINGYPIFVSMIAVNQADSKTLLARAKVIQKAIKAA